MKKKNDAEKQFLARLYASSPNPKLKWRTDVVVGEMNADLYVQSPTGTTSAFQIKNWDPTPENKSRARNLASIYRQLSSTDTAYVVIPGLAENDPENGIISPEFIYHLPELLSVKPQKDKSSLPKVRKSSGKTIFVAMPFSEEYDDTFEVGIQGACLQLGYKSVRVDRETFSTDIVSEIKKSIKKAAVVIGDLSESRPNVLYEIGFAEASKRKVIQICSTPIDDMPFDVRNNRTIEYTKGQTTKLKEKLVNELRAFSLK